MSEPKTKADNVKEISSRLYHWKIHDDRIQFRSDSYAIRTDDGIVMIDPLPLTQEALEKLQESGDIKAICLTGRFHQRAAWRYQQKFGVNVYAPHNGKDFEGVPDELYKPGDNLPGNIEVIHSPGPTDAHYSFYADVNGEKILFCADLLTRKDEQSVFGFVPDQYMDEPEKTRDSVRKLMDFEIDILCPDHGDPQIGSVKEAMEKALEKNSES